MSCSEFSAIHAQSHNTHTQARLKKLVVRWAISCFFLFLHSFQHFARCWSSPLSRSLKVSFFICEFQSQFIDVYQSWHLVLSPWRFHSWNLDSSQGNIFASNLESFDSWLFTCIGFGVFFSWTFKMILNLFLSSSLFSIFCIFLRLFLKWAQMLLFLITL